MLEAQPLGYIGALAAMIAALYLMRAGGYWLMGRIAIGPRVRRMLEALPGAVIAATVAPIVAKGGATALAAVGVAVAAMLLLRNDFFAVIAGVAAVALLRAAGL